MSKKKWVLIIDGAYLKIIGDGLPSKVPTYFENSKSGKVFLLHNLIIGIETTPVLQEVFTSWLYSILNGEIEVPIRLYKK